MVGTSLFTMPSERFENFSGKSGFEGIFQILFFLKYQPERRYLSPETLTTKIIKCEPEKK